MSNLIPPSGLSSSLLSTLPSDLILFSSRLKRNEATTSRHYRHGKLSLKKKKDLGKKTCFCLLFFLIFSLTQSIESCGMCPIVSHLASFVTHTVGWVCAINTHCLCWDHPSTTINQHQIKELFNSLQKNNTNKKKNPSSHRARVWSFSHHLKVHDESTTRERETGSTCFFFLFIYSS